MPIQLESAHAIYTRVLARLLDRIHAAPVWEEPFSHTYFEELFPADVYTAMLASLPPANVYWTGPNEPNGQHLVRSFYNLTTTALRRFPASSRNLWRGVAAALTDPELRRCLFAKLAPDLMHRFGIARAKVPDLVAHPRPSLYREIEGYELPPHTDTLKKIVTMHLYLPADLSQLLLGTALYERKPGPSSKCDVMAGFTRVKQFEFRPNSGYAFVVNDSSSRQSWHGRERLPGGSGVRNTLLNTFYVECRPGYSGYLNDDTPAVHTVRNSATA